MSAPSGRLPGDGRGQGPREDPAGAHQGQLALHRAPPGVPRLRRRQEVRERRGRRRAPLPRPLLERRLHRVADPDPAAARARPPRCCKRTGFDAAQPRRQGADGHPGDLPARRAVPHAGRRAGADGRGRDARPRAPPAAALHPPRHLRPLRLGARLPAARPLQHRASASGSPRSSRTGSAASRSSSPCSSPSRRPPGSTSWCTRPRAPRSPTSTPPTSSAGWPRPPARGATTSSPPSIAEYGEEVGTAPGPPLRRLLPRGLQGGLRGPHRRGRPRPARGARRATRASTCRSTSSSTPAAARRGSRSSGSGRRSRSPRSCRCSRRWASRSSTSGPTSSTALDRPTYIYEFGLRYGRRAARRTPASSSRTRSARCGTASTRSTASTRWCSRAGLTWRQATVLRAYAKYMRQGNSPFALDYIEDALRSNVDITRLLVQLFEARFDPGRDRLARRGARTARVDDVEERIAPGARRRGQPRPRPHPALLPHPHPGDAAHQLLPAGRRAAAACSRTSPSSSSRRRSPTCPRRGRGSRSSSTRRGSRACTCASARSPAAGCAGRTAATTSAPRCSAWSRRRW